jgi:TRAP-type mannitol/chloroaromatic compound transport system permease small subunit
MKGLLKLAHAIDGLNTWLGKMAVWAIFISCMISAINATLRYLINQSSNSWLEVQWYLFAATVMLGAPLVLRVNEHVRVDVIYGKLSSNARAWVDLLGLIFFLLPATLLICWMAWPWFLDAYKTSEMSSNAGGLIRWPMKILMPIGFFVLSLQGISEIIKRIGYLRGQYEMQLQYERPLQ